MALRRSRLTLIFIYVILFFALCAKPISSQGKEDVPAPSLPKLDLQKSLGSGDLVKRVIEHLEILKPAIENYQKWFPQRKACWKSSQSAKHCYDQCQENYGVALDFDTAGIESLNKQDIPKAKCDIGNINTNVQKCQDCFEQTGNGGDQAMTDINMWVKHIAQWCLDVLHHVNGVQKLSVDQNDKEEVPPPSLPKFGVQKSLGDQNGDPAKAAIEHLEWLKPAIEDYKNWFPQKKACRATPESARPCCDQCQENYGVASDFVTGSIESLNKQDLPKANTDINNIATNIQKCQDCFEQTGNGGDQEIKNINESIKTNVEWCLGLLNTADNGVQKLSVAHNDDATKRAIEQLEGIKHDL